MNKYVIMSNIIGFHHSAFSFLSIASTKSILSTALYSFFLLVHMEMEAERTKMDLGNSGLTDLIFSWSLNDILNRDLYLNKVEKIPQTFSSVEQYLNSFVKPLMEETHADLSSGVNSVRQASTCQILNLSKSKDSRGNKPGKYIVEFDQDTESKKNKQMYKPQSGDVILLSNVVPTNINYFKRFPRSFVLGIVQKGKTYDRIRTSEPVSEVRRQMSRQSSVHAVYLMNATTNIRIWNALKQETSKSNLDIIKRILQANSNVGMNCDHCFNHTSGSCAKDVDVDIESFNLNESQTDAVLSSIETSRCIHKNTIKLIWGPPGTGKTKTVATLLYALRKKKVRTLVCAPTNTAVVEVTSRLLTLQKGCYGMGDILLFGNSGRMKIDDNPDLLDVFLDSRVKELWRFSSEWKNCLDLMISLLEDPSSNYLLYLEGVKKRKERMEQAKDKADKEDRKGKAIEETCLQGKGRGEEDDTVENVLTIGEFFRKRFKVAKKNLKDCIKVLVTNLPTSFMPIDVIECMKRAVEVMDNIGSLLTDNNITSVDLKKISIPYDDTGLTTFSVLLYKSRKDCFKILTSLRETFSVPEFADTDLLKEYCLQNACLVFCTASSSSTLQTDDMTPFRMLVIDEAAQLKECESVVPLLLPSIRHAILVGDERQLPAMIKSKICADADFGRSMFERLVSLGQMKHLLNVQYRMHPAISLFPNTEFYDNQISDGSNVEGSSHRKEFLQGAMYGPYSFINVAYGKEIMENGHSPRNPVEAAVISHIVAKLFETSVAANQKISVGVISPYNAQVFGIQKMLSSTYEMHSNFTLSVRSVDGFQGGEEDVIIISTVRSNQNGSVGFLHNHQRTNVSLTRARHCLWIVGNESTLVGSDTVWKKLVLNAKHRGCFFNADDDGRLAEGIVDAMIELDQLDVLRNMDSMLFKGARWKVIFGDGFHKSLERLRDTDTQKEVVSLLKKLSSGWRESAQNEEYLNAVNGISSQLLKQNKIKGLNVIWSVDIFKETTKYIQVLKFWDIVSAIEIPAMVRRLNLIFHNYTRKKISHCTFRSREGDLEVPMSWEVGSDGVNPNDGQDGEHVDLSTQLAALNLD